MRALVIKHVRREDRGRWAFLAGRGVDLDREMEESLPVNLDGAVADRHGRADERGRARSVPIGRIELIQGAIERDVPMLGICLGKLLCRRRADG
jgi:hypothetical protein